MRRLAALAVLLICAATALVVARQHHQRVAAVERGKALYTGAAALPGRLPGHDLTLPTGATRCNNCHEAASRDAVATFGSGSGSSSRYAPALESRTLTAPQVRRGGPASSFDARTFCTLLRTGTDPAQVMIDVNMPRYEATDNQCQDLWTYLQSR